VCSIAIENGKALTHYVKCFSFGPDCDRIGELPNPQSKLNNPEADKRRFRMRSKYILVGVVVGVLFTSVLVVLAGNIDSPEAPTHADAQMYTLQQIYDRLDTGAESAKMSQFTEPATGPVTGTMHTLDEVYALVGQRAPVPKTGQTDCYYSDGIETGTCTCGTANCPSGQDGDLEKGVSWPIPRFTDNGNGTVTDNLTGLIWLKDADCVGLRTWSDAFVQVGNLNSGAEFSCDSYAAGTFSDWRLPNVRELFSLIDFSRDDKALPSGYPFTGVTAGHYWSSTTFAKLTDYAWNVRLCYDLLYHASKTDSHYVWPVRGGQ